MVGEEPNGSGELHVVEPRGNTGDEVPLTVALCSSTSLTCGGRELVRIPDDWRLSQCSSRKPDTEPVVEFSVTVRHCECRAVVPTHCVALPAHVTENTDPVLPMMLNEPRTFSCRGPSLVPRRAAATTRQSSMARSTTPRRERTAPRVRPSRSAQWAGRRIGRPGQRVGRARGGRR